MSLPRIRMSHLNRSSSLTLLCVLLSGCGGAGSFLPTTGSKSVPGVPSGPTAGFVWSSTDETLRPILGVVGSSQVGASIVPAGTYVSGSASSANDTGLVEDSLGNLFALNLPVSQPSLVATGLPPQAQIVFSPSGANAVAYAAGGSAVTLITGLPSTPKASAISTAQKLSVAIVSDAGTVLAATQTAPASVGTLSASGQFSPLTSVVKVGGMNFLPAIDDALVADASKNTVSILHSVSGTLAIQMLNSTGVSQPLAVSATQDARWAVVANAGNQNILWIDLKNGGTPATLACNCQPNQLNALSGGKSFRLNDLGSGPLWLLDLTSSPQLVFVPAVH
jgi:hypothetical protein